MGAPPLGPLEGTGLRSPLLHPPTFRGGRQANSCLIDGEAVACDEKGLPHLASVLQQGRKNANIRASWEPSGDSRLSPIRTLFLLP
jgi:hypothetical protein